MGAKKNLHSDTLSLQPVSELKMKLLQAILRSKWRRFAWQTPEAQGSDLSGNLFLCWNPCHKQGTGALVEIWAAGRRDRGVILHGSLTDEQRHCTAKDPQPRGLSSGARLAALLFGYRAPSLCSLSRLASRPPVLSALIPYL